MKMLITGGAGYIGAHSVHYLVNNGYNPKEIIVFDNLIYGHKDNLPKDVIFVKGDLLNKMDINKIFVSHKIEAVMHFAAFAYVGESMNDPGKYFENNIVGGLNLLQAMKNYGCKKIVFSSTCATYGTPKKIPITEKERQKPINPYGESKLTFEKILEWYWNCHEIRSIRLRYFNAAGAAYGIGEHHEPETHLIPLVLEAAQDSKKSISVYGTDCKTEDGTCIRDYIHVVDLADAHKRALDYIDVHNVSLGLNLGTGRGTSVQKIIDLAKKITGKKIKVIYKDRRSGDPDILISNPSHAKKILNWEAKHSIVDIMSDAWRWHKRPK